MSEPDRRDHQLAHYRFLETLQETLTGARDLTGLYGAAAHRIAAELEGTSVALHLYDGVSGTVSTAHQSGPRALWDEGALLQAAKTQRTVTRETTIAVPIVSRESGQDSRCWGVIAVQREPPADVLFTSIERQTLRAAADRIGAELQRRQVLLLDDVLDGLLRKTKPIDVYMHALRELRRFIRYDHSASIMTIQRGVTQVIVRAEKVVAVRGRRQSLTDSPRMGKALRLTAAQMRFLSDLAQPIQLRRDGDRFELVGEQDGAAAGLWRALCLSDRREGAILCVPLAFGGQVLGVLRVAANHVHAFDGIDCRTLERFARLLSVTLYRSELYHRSDRQLKAIKQVGRAITESPGVDEVCKQVLQHALRVLHVEVGAVGLVDEDGQLRLVAHQGSTLPEAPTLAMGEGIAGSVVRTGRAQAVPNVSTHPGYVLFNGRVRSELAAPIVYDNEVIGFLDVESYEEGRFREEDEEAMSFVEALANQAAIAIKTAQLHDAARQRLGTAMSIDPTLSMAGLHDLLVQELQDKIEQLAGTNERLAAANKAKSEFLAHMSHDLRGPLNVIVGLSSLLVDPLVAPTLSDERRKESLELIRANGERLSSLIGNILDISAVEAGRGHLEVTPVDLSRSLDYLAAMARALAAESDKQLDLSVRIDGEIRTILADEDKFSRIVQNLLFNAVKFTPSGGSVSVIVRRADRAGTPGRGGGRDLHMTVSDTGVGIAPEDQHRIFEPFQQAHHLRPRQYHGTGIGLAVVRQFVELHGGRIWLESAPGLGSSFHVVLPDAIAGDEEVLDGTPDGSSSTAVAGTDRPTILVIEDIPAHMSVMRLAVTSRGYTMHGVGTGEEALDWLTHNRPGLIVLDMQLPDTDGFALASQIRSRVETHDVPIVAVSADALSINEERAKASGCDVFLTKPVDIGQLLLVIEAATA